MADETHDPQVGAEPAAAGVALGRASRSKDVDARAAEYLAKQSRVLDGQLEDQDLHHRHLRLKYFGDRLRIGLQLLAIVFGLAVAVGLGALVWQAHEADGVVIEAFSAPPDLAAKGLSGQVLASQLQDRLNRLQAATYSARPEASYSHGWGEDVKVEIPETGVSIGELQRRLRGWLGHETRIGGEVYRTSTGLGLTVRASDRPGDEVTGPEDDLPGLLQKGAEALYASTQPYRYGEWLREKGRIDEAHAIFQKLADEGPPEERAWAFVGLSNLAADGPSAVALARQALAIDPKLGAAWIALGGGSQRTDDRRTMREATQRAIDLIQGQGHGGYSDRMLITARNYKAAMATFVSNYAACRQEDEAALLLVRDATSRRSFESQLALCLSNLHETSAARALAHGEDDEARTRRGIGGAMYATAARRDENWPELLRQAQGRERALTGDPDPNKRHTLETAVLTEEVGALAEMGRLDEARAIFARVPPFPARGATEAMLALQSGDRAAAERLYLHETQRAPNPYVIQRLGRFRLDGGDLDGALAAFRQGVALGPWFADNHEGWGEVLLARGNAAGAIAKFAEAQKTAPRWARLHLKWGEALVKLGKRDEARAQFKAAATMDLTAAERAELAAQKV
jgi:tetratricopeptide (TPR) repeat protein